VKKGGRYGGERKKGGDSQGDGKRGRGDERQSGGEKKGEGESQNGRERQGGGERQSEGGRKAEETDRERARRRMVKKSMMEK
jgi:hypothetical protein